MRNPEARCLTITLAGTLLLASCAKQEPASSAVDAAKLKMFTPLTAAVSAESTGASEARIALGRMLFYDERLSKSQTISCNTCHNLAAYGVDGEPTSGGHKGQRGDRNSPSVYNAAGHFVQFWDGRAPDVEEQAKGPVMNPVEMAMPSEKNVIAVLKSMPGYVEAFRLAFPEEKNPVTFANMANAIGAFERKLLTPGRWDRFLSGDQAALTTEEKAGLAVFTSAGCQGCHSGAYLGGNLFQKLGALRPYPDESDPGRFKVTKREGDKMVFKVPSLRNIDKTGPYFHNGAIATLDDAVSEMAEYQLGKQLTPDDRRSVVAFLKALTGELPAEYIRKPELPKSTALTPKPDPAD